MVTVLWFMVILVKMVIVNATMMLGITHHPVAVVLSLSRVMRG